MIIGVPKEIKNREDRVGITPQGVRTLVSQNHKVIIEKSAGLGSGFSDEEASQLAVVASMYQNIADTQVSAEQAAASGAEEKKNDDGTVDADFSEKK